MYIFTSVNTAHTMHLLGEFDCKLDAKGRLMVPAALKKQLPEIEREGFVINRGFEQCLTLYPRKVWNVQMERLGSLNAYDRKNRDFIRLFTRGATEITLDSVGRVLLPKGLMESAGLKADVVLVCQLDKVELWDKKKYDELLELDDKAFAALAEEVMKTLPEAGGVDG